MCLYFRLATNHVCKTDSNVVLSSAAPEAMDPVYDSIENVNRTEVSKCVAD